MVFKKFFYKKINSTNDTALKKIRQKFQSGIVVSQQQIKGKGQYGRKWISQKGNLFSSIFFKVNKKITLKRITELNIYIIKKILSNLIEKKITIKLPNDLLINNKKICGILQEIIFYKNNKYVIIGIGINLIKNPKIKNYPTSNIFKETGKKIQIKKLVKLIENNYKNKLKQFA